MSRFHHQLGTLIAALSTAVCALGQIEAAPIKVSTPAGIARGWAATVDLANPSVSVVALAESADAPGTAKLVTPDAWLNGDGELRLVINANFFGAKPDATATIVGVCVTEDGVLNRPRSHEGRFDPALVITSDGRAVIGHLDGDALSDARAAVAGVGGSETSSVAGTLLVGDGESLGSTARVQPLARHPRTAVGVSEDGRELFIVVIDGRQEGWSVGVTLPELAELLLERGAWDAVNLDGGGSSALLWRDGQRIESNQPSDGDYRPVAVSLGVRVAECAPASKAGGE